MKLNGRVCVRIGRDRHLVTGVLIAYGATCLVKIDGSGRVAERDPKRVYPLTVLKKLSERTKHELRRGRKPRPPRGA